MNGVECLKELKSAENTREIPVVMYTTLGDRAQENVILKLGADYYMRKTYSFDELCTELHRLLDEISQKEVKSARK
jgi:DNA-binding response OmpR family regulator